MVRNTMCSAFQKQNQRILKFFTHLSSSPINSGSFSSSMFAILGYHKVTIGEMLINN